MQSIYSPNLFQNKTILITGASTGIGRTTAFELASLNATLILTARNLSKLEQTKSEILALFPNTKIQVLSLDIRSPLKTIKEKLSVLKEEGMIVSGLVNNAGGQFLQKNEEMTERGWQSVVDLNLNGSWKMSRAVFDLWMKDHGGSICFVTVAGANGFPLMSHSGAARAGIENLVKSLAVEWSPYGIRLNAVASGTVIGNGMLNYPEPIRSSVLTKLPPQIPMNRLGLESEISSVILFLLSDGSSYMTGQTLRVDGGLTLAKSLVGGDKGNGFYARPLFKDINLALPKDLGDDFKQAYQKITSKL